MEQSESSHCEEDEGPTRAKRIEGPVMVVRRSKGPLSPGAKGKFHMAPPSIAIMGIYPLGTCTKPDTSVDLAVTIPADVLHPKDALNQRYPRRRALYLAGLAQHLASSHNVGTMRYSCLHGNRLRPILLLTPPDSSSFILRLQPCRPPGFFKPSRRGITSALTDTLAWRGLGQIRVSRPLPTTTALFWGTCSPGTICCS
ncbi:nucleolar protein 6-like [Salmo trutta]|uniref:nucleolar protein 6-like n=1 Tax=Salmo trutta TaxID=8032 RepID=UPI00112FE56E|nr:nucleolar protein 6-like [Salmo trutta]